MAKFVTIGERLSVTAPTVNKAFAARDEEPILKRAKQQLDAGAVYLDVNIGPAENDGEDIMKWAVELLQSNFDNVPLALDTSNKKAIEAGISVYNRSKGKPIVNSADAAGRIEYVDLAAANDAIVIALCNGEGIAKEKLALERKEKAEYAKKVGQLTMQVDWLKKKSEETLGPDYESKFSPKPFED